MKKLLSLSLALLSLSLFAGEYFSAGFNNEFYTGYQWRNQMSNTEGAYHGCLWADVPVFSNFYLGGYIWQNYDMTNNRGYKYANALTETDFGIHVGGKAWDNESESFPMALSFEFGHEWYLYHRRVRSHFIHPDTNEIYLNATLSNPIANLYGGVATQYHNYGDYRSGFHYMLGFNKEVSVPKLEALKLGADWNVGFANKQYQYWLIGTRSSGFTGTTLKFYAKYFLTEYLYLKPMIAYTGILNGDAREEMKSWNHDKNPRDALWGMLAINLVF